MLHLACQMSLKRQILFEKVIEYYMVIKMQMPYLTTQNFSFSIFISFLLCQYLIKNFQITYCTKSASAFTFGSKFAIFASMFLTTFITVIHKNKLIMLIYAPIFFYYIIICYFDVTIIICFFLMLKSCVFEAYTQGVIW